MLVQVLLVVILVHQGHIIIIPISAVLVSQVALLLQRIHCLLNPTPSQLILPLDLHLPLDLLDTAVAVLPSTHLLIPEQPLPMRIR